MWATYLENGLELKRTLCEQTSQKPRQNPPPANLLRERQFLPQKLLITGPNGEKIPLISSHDLFDFFRQNGNTVRRPESVGMARGVLGPSHRPLLVREVIQRLAIGGRSRNAVWDRLPSSLWSSEALPSRPWG